MKGREGKGREGKGSIAKGSARASLSVYYKQSKAKQNIRLFVCLFVPVQSRLKYKNVRHGAELSFLK